MIDTWQAIDGLDYSVWQMPDREHLTLESQSVDVWAFSQGQSEAIAAQLRPILHETEHLRAEKFYTPHLQNQYIVRHAILRKILALYRLQDAKSIEFHFGENGKPALVDGDIHFNLSHSHTMVVVAIAKNPMIGIDVEYNQPISDMALVAKHHFSQDEQATLFALPETEQMAAFYRCWTRKEAYIKSDGRGLQVPLDSFDVSLAPDEPPKILRIGRDRGVGSRWTMQTLALPINYTGVVLVSGEIGKLRFFRFNDLYPSH